jgi:hypothetical protein
MDQRPDLQLREQFFFQKKYYATPFTREEKEFLTRFYFRSPLLLAKSNPNPTKPPKIIFLLDDKQMSKPGNRLITAFITESKLFEPVLDPIVLQTKGVSFKEWKTVCILYEEINCLYPGSIVLSFNKNIYKLVPNFRVSVLHLKFRK